jgi:diguanylate cyclase (GGDEF)-like protein
MLFAILDWFLRRHPAIGEETRMRARLVVGLLLLNLLVLFLITAGLVVVIDANERYMREMMLSLVPTTLLYGGALLFFARTLSFVITGNLFLITQWGAILTGIIITGGTASSPMLPMLVLVAEYAFLLIGLRGGLWWSAVVISTLCTLAMVNYSGVQFEVISHPAHMAFYQIATPLLLLVTSALALVLYEVMTSNLRRALAMERNQFAHKAAHDPLTGLANRDEFQRNLMFAIRQAHLRQRHCAVVYIDLDRFKPINDQYGHATGDQVLRVVAERLQQFVRGSDIVARLGGDEFAVILMGLADVAEASALVEKLRGVIEQPIPHGGATLAVGASYGIAIYPDMADSSTELLRLADEAMYNAKRARKQQRISAA